jgi:hypothetical protein
MNALKVTLDSDGRKEEILFQIKRMVNAGYTGRNQKAVRQHIEELKKRHSCP